MPTHTDDRLWLPEDGEHPPRPNVAILRHLTYPEAHAFEIGFFGAAGLVALYLQVGPAAVVAALVTARVVARRYVSTHETLPRELRAALGQLWYVAVGGAAGAAAAYLGVVTVAVAG